MKNIIEKEFREVCEQSKSMAEASKLLGLHFSTFKRWAIKLDCYKTNQSGKGIQKPLKEYVNTKKPHHVKNKLWTLGLKEKKCEVCGLGNQYNGKPLTLELHHIDGNNTNNNFDNLQILCPNCHSQTHTYRRRKHLR
jgi:5-methylcytosine-specific restriction endonuclease McrA